MKLWNLGIIWKIVYGLALVTTLVLLSFLVSFFSVQSYDEQKALLIQEECKLRLQKQVMLDNLTYTKSIEYNKGNYTNSGLDGIDKLLKNGLSTIEQCSGINYHGVSLGVTKVYATEYSESTKDQRKGRVRHLGYPEDSIVQLYVNYAYWVSGGDVDFLATLDAENGRRVSHRQSEVPDVKGPNGKEDSYGFCMLHRNRHSNIVDDPRFRSDPRRQISQCRFKYNGGTRFYGYDVRHKSKKRFKVIRPIGQ